MESDLIEHLLGAHDGLVPVDLMALHYLVAEIDVLIDGELREKSKLLIDDRYALRLAVRDRAELLDLALVYDIAGVGAVFPNSGEHLHQRGFSGSVFADETVDLAALHLEVYVIQRLYAGELLGDVPHFKDIFVIH